MGAARGMGRVHVCHNPFDLRNLWIIQHRTPLRKNIYLAILGNTVSVGLSYCAALLLVSQSVHNFDEPLCHFHASLQLSAERIDRYVRSSTMLPYMMLPPRTMPMGTPSVPHICHAPATPIRDQGILYIKRASVEMVLSHLCRH